MKKLTILFALLTLSAGMWAQTMNNVKYIDANGVEQTANNVTLITNTTTTLTEGWYFVMQANTRTLVCTGAVHLILFDAAKLTATGSDDQPGIKVSGDGNSLTIYGQANQLGQLIANGGRRAAGIGGGYQGDGSNITINGGTVIATAGDGGAGIGGGWHGNHFGNGSNITINGGIVTATGGQNGAGIGGGQGGNGTHITINGGKVTATGGDNGAGIGGGLGGTSGGLGSYITITGGNVTANGGNSGAGIGGGSGMPGGPCLCSNITITGGKVTANGGSGASGIGGNGLESSSSNIIIAATLLVKADNFNNPPTTVIPNTGADLASTLNGKQHVTAEPIIITYGEHITVSPEFESGDNVAYGTYTFTAADRSAVVDDSYYEFLGFYKESTFNTPITEGVSGYVYTLTVNEAAISVYAKYRQHFSVPYIDADGQEQTAADAGEIANNTLNAGWYVVRGSDENHGPLTCNGAVHIILADDAKLTATGWDNVPGITVSGEGNSLTIYGQTAQTGQLVATGGYDAAGIGGGWQGSGSNITINGGTVTANGGGNAAGIGGGFEGSGSNITIYGGTVTANGGRGGAGIGGGWCGSGSNITINGGTVTANAGAEASCIGRGYVWGGNSCFDIFVATEFIIRAGNDNPPTTVIAHTATTDIAGDLDGKRYATVRIPQPCIVTYGDYITVSPQFASGGTVAVGTEITFTAADRFAGNYEFLGFYKESTFENKITNGVSGLTYTATVLDDDISVYAKYKEFASTPYIDANGQEQTANAAEITNETSTLNAGWYVVTGEVSRGNITCNGAVHLILADGAKLTATGGDDQAGITISGNSLTIYGQSAQSGQLFANGGRGGAGIGGGHGSGSNITINGGEVTATGGQNAAGIGGGDHGSGSNITINGGTVTANGGRVGAGIGGGCMDAGSNITINGGTVTATGGEWASAIGGGWQGSGSNITINGGTVTANGGDKGASIGGGYEGSGWDIKVAAALTIYADNTNPPTSEILHTSDYDIADNLAGKRYAVVKDDITDIKEAAIAAINAAIEGVTNEDIIAIATNAINAINAATSVDVINAIKEQALAAIASAKAIYASGLGEMGEPCEDCPAVDVTKGTTTIRLYSPESVTFKKTE